MTSSCPIDRLSLSSSSQLALLYITSDLGAKKTRMLPFLSNEFSRLAPPDVGELSRLSNARRAQCPVRYIFDVDVSSS